MPILTAAAAPDFPDDDSPEGDDALMQRVGARDDAAAFACLVRKYQHRIQGFAFRMLGRRDAESARDVAQETFVRLWEARAKYEGRGSLLPYLLRIAGNLCRDRLRAEPPGVALVELNDETDAGRGGGDGGDPASGAVGLADAVAQALKSLPEEQRAVFVLSHYERLSYREIAEALGCPMGTVASRKYLAVEALRRQLKDWFEG